MGLVGRIDVAVIGERIIDCAGYGHLVVAHAESAQVRIDRIVATAPRGSFDVLFDGSHIESFSPGLPARWLPWVARQHFTRSAVVGRPGPMFGIASTFRYLLPRRRLGVFVDRTAAIAWLQSANDERE